MTDLDWTKLPKALLDREREHVVGYEWWGFVYDEFIEDMNTVGIEVDTYPVRLNSGKFTEKPDIEFSLHTHGRTGFAGYITDWPLFFDKHELTQTYPMLAQPNVMDELAYSVGTSGASQFNCEFTFDCDIFGEQFAMEMAGLLEHELGAAEVDIDNIFSGYNNKLYGMLEAEYEWLTSDECIIENLKNNYTDEEVLEMIREIDGDAWKELVGLAA
jgi:hypothetical protein